MDDLNETAVLSERLFRSMIQLLNQQLKRKLCFIIFHRVFKY